MGIPLAPLRSAKGGGAGQHHGNHFKIMAIMVQKTPPCKTRGRFFSFVGLGSRMCGNDEGCRYGAMPPP